MRYGTGGAGTRRFTHAPTDDKDLRFRVGGRVLTAVYTLKRHRHRCVPDSRTHAASAHSSAYRVIPRPTTLETDMTASSCSCRLSSVSERAGKVSWCLVGATLMCARTLVARFGVSALSLLSQEQDAAAHQHAAQVPGGGEQSARTPQSAMADARKTRGAADRPSTHDVGSETPDYKIGGGAHHDLLHGRTRKVTVSQFYVRPQTAAPRHRARR